MLWHELNATAGEPARKQVEDARMGVDFLISLISGHLHVVVAAAIGLAADVASRPWLAVATIVSLPPLAAVWYRLAVEATDE
ncbi:hypothetical protein [Saccharothrix variisporea]|uniref:Uncharacterized protein n=1 Tax=Saccharothrix variisporea TaxID=543527 RepID=A0A495XK20_9PSEU|nr:hypothetical protein [Saccharothrix variisporea]RKT74447.1 hypothetical protein DFJ66_7805 [Saccharothrix variisporea]